MSLSQQDRVQFVNSYTRALISAWSSEEYSTLLSDDPRAALAEAGLELPAGASIDIVRAVPQPNQGNEEGGVDVQVDLYEKGLETNTFEFRIPAVPQVDTAELSDSELEGVAAGDTIACSCTPCCCCT